MSKNLIFLLLFDSLTIKWEYGAKYTLLTQSCIDACKSSLKYLKKKKNLFLNCLGCCVF